jgi:hypothetical protein
MIQKIKNTLVAVAALVALSAPALLPVSAYAASTVNINDSLCGGSNIKLSQDSSCKSGGANTNSLQTLLSNIVNIFSIIVGGLRYITSGGDSGNVSTAKNTIIYAIVGLVIVALAQLIVHFVLNQTSNLTT